MEIVSLFKICSPKQWKTLGISSLKPIGYPVFGANGIIGFYNEYTHEKPVLAITCRGATCGTVNITLPKSYINGNAMALDNLDENRACLKYLYFYFVYRGFKDIISGSAQPQITRIGLQKINITLPPLPEQKRIVEILDKADALRRKRKQAIELLDEFLRSVFSDMFGDPVKNPKGWKLNELKSNVSFLSGGTPSKLNKQFWQGDFPWVSPKDMKRDYIDSAIDTISDNVFSETSLKKVPTKSILIVVRGMILVHTVPVAMNTIPIAINQDIKALIVKPDRINSTFLFYTLKTQQKNILNKVSTAAHGTKRIEMREIETLPIINPPIILQKKFVATMEKVNLTRKKMLVSNREMDNQFNALMQRAFKGGVECELKIVQKDGSENKFVLKRRGLL